MAPWYELLDSFKEFNYLKKHQDLAKELLTKCHIHFDMDEIEILMVMFYKILLDNRESREKERSPSSFVHEECIDLEKLHKIMYRGLKMTNSVLVERVLLVLSNKRRDHCVTLETWINAMSLMLRGTLDEKIDFCFRVYDENGAGVLDKMTVYRHLSGTIRSQTSETDADETVKDLTDTVIKKLNKNRDGKISFTEYKEAVYENPLMLEFLGPCLPDRLVAYAFLASFSPHLHQVTAVRRGSLEERSLEIIYAHICDEEHKDFLRPTLTDVSKYTSKDTVGTKDSSSDFFSYQSSTSNCSTFRKHMQKSSCYSFSINDFMWNEIFGRDSFTSRGTITRDRFI